MTEYAAWSDQTKLNRLIEMREQGIPFSRIADELGITKNAAVGKFRRVFAERAKTDSPIKVPAKALSNRNGHEKKAVKPKKPEFVPLPELRDIEIPESKRVTLEHVNFGQCRWVIGDTDGPETVFCGAPVERRSFCAGHTALAFYTPNRSKPSLTNRIKRPFKLQRIMPDVR